MIRQQTLLKVKEYMENALKECAPEITPDQLCDNGAIYYRNGNDGTDFDWEMNNRTCEFMMFYKSTEMGILKVFVTKDGCIVGYYYGDEGKADGILIDPEYIGETTAEKFCLYLLSTYDGNDKWDEAIDFGGAQ